MEEISIFCKSNFIKIRYFHFGNTKAAVLQCKTYAFIVQNNRFWNAKQ